MKSPVFVPKSEKSQAGFDIETLLRKKSTAGEIGIEIEVEGNKFPKHAVEGYDSVDPHFIPDMWQYHRDGSLRGEDNAEYVLKNPIKFSEVPDAVNKLWEMFDKYGTVLETSNRTSVHVHLNAQRFHLNRLCSFMAMYFAVEEILTAWCGEHRIGNLFCLRAKDAPAIISKLKKFLQSESSQYLTDGLHYSGMNAEALKKYGSIEIRSLRGVTDPSTILTWVSILERMYKMSEEFPDPREICANFSGSGPLAFMEFILGDNTQEVRQNVSFTNQQVMESLYEGIRLAQDLCYCRDWSKYEPINVKPDKFGRSKKKVGMGLVEEMSNVPDGLSTANTFQEYYNMVVSNNYDVDIVPTPPNDPPPDAVWVFGNETESDDTDEEFFDEEEDAPYDPI